MGTGNGAGLNGMKSFLIALGITIVGASLWIFVFSSSAFAVSEAERATCDLAAGEAASFDVTGMEVSYAIRTGTGGRHVRVTYPGGGQRPSFTCQLVDGEIVGLVRSEPIAPRTREPREQAI